MQGSAEQQIILMILGVVFSSIIGIIAFFLKQTMRDFKDMEKDMNIFKETIPKEYATKHELANSRNQLDERLDRIDDKLDRVLELAWKVANTNGSGRV